MMLLFACTLQKNPSRYTFLPIMLFIPALDTTRAFLDISMREISVISIFHNDFTKRSS